MSTSFLHSRGLQLITAAAVVAVVGACSTKLNAGAERGTLAVQLTDAPFVVDSVLSVDIFVVRVDARLADVDSTNAARGATDDSASTGGWATIATPNRHVNLLAFQNGVFLALGSTNVSAGSYLGFRLVIDPSKSSVTLRNGLVLSGTSTPNVSFPSAARSGIKIQLTQPMVVSANDTTTVLIDFDVANSFVLRGNTLSQQGLLFKPVLRGTIRP
jgi:hypothetical protein